jgi:hypothetical protein
MTLRPEGKKSSIKKERFAVMPKIDVLDEAVIDRRFYFGFLQARLCPPNFFCYSSF